MECRLYKLIEFGQSTGADNVVMGETRCMHIDDTVLKDGRLESDALDLVGLQPLYAELCKLFLTAMLGAGTASRRIYRKESIRIIAPTQNDYIAGLKPHSANERHKTRSETYQKLNCHPQ